MSDNLQADTVLPRANAPNTSNARMQQHAVRMALFLVGYGFATWAALIPFAKMRAELDEGGLGLLLLSLGIGSVGTMPITGGLVNKFSCRIVVAVSALVFCVILPLLAWLESVPGLAVCIFLLGGAMGAIEVAANIQAVYVQREAGRAMMSGFHAFYSVGSIAGAGSITLCLTSGLSTLQAGLVSVIVVLASLLVFGRGLMGPRNHNEGQEGEKRKTQFFAIPRGIVAVLGLMLMFMYIAEGSVANWGALLLAGFKQFEPEEAAIGFTIFSITIAVGRLLGDKVTVLLGGSSRTIIISSLLTALTYFCSVQFLPGNAVLLGYAALGLVMAPMVPCIFTLAGKQTVMPEELAISAVTAFGYASALFSSPVIGMIARHTSLPTSLSLLSLLLCFVALCTFLLYRKKKE